jgi:hypothetical protein
MTSPDKNITEAKTPQQSDSIQFYIIYYGIYLVQCLLLGWGIGKYTYNSWWILSIIIGLLLLLPFSLRYSKKWIFIKSFIILAFYICWYLELTQYNLKGLLDNFYIFLLIIVLNIVWFLFHYSKNNR